METESLIKKHITVYIQYTQFKHYMNFACDDQCVLVSLNSDRAPSQKPRRLSQSAKVA